jgi:hypothetical protein
MSQQISLKETERKVFKTTFEDGLWDVFIGCIVLQFAIGPLLSVSLGDFWSSVVFLPFWGLVFLAIRLIRKYVITPRIGTVKFGRARQVKLRKFTVVMLVLNVVALFLGVFAALSFGVVPGWVTMAIFGLIVLNGSCIAAYFLDFARLYVYGIMFVLSFVVGELLYTYLQVPHHGYPVAFGFTATAIILTGLVIFIRLVRNNPVPKPGSTL